MSSSIVSAAEGTASELPSSEFLLSPPERTVVVSETTISSSSSSDTSLSLFLSILTSFVLDFSLV